MKKCYCLLATASMCLIAFSVKAQEKATFTRIDNLPFLSVISENGNWIGGSQEGATYLYNAVTKEIFDISESGEYGMSVRGASNDGIFVGSYGVDMNAPAAFYRDGKWNVLDTIPGYGAGGAFNITPDSRIIVGFISGGYSTGTLPCRWIAEGNNYKLELLPAPDKDIFGMEPQGTVAVDVSNDGTIILGRFTDWTGFYTQMIVWKLGTDNAYSYELLGTKMMYNLNEENPGVVVEWENYVTVNEGEPGYEEQVAKYNIDYAKREALMEKFLTDTVFDGGVYNLSGNGRYVTTNITLPDPNADPMDFFAQTLDIPYCFDLKKVSGRAYSDYTTGIGCATTNSGIVIYSDPYSEMVRNAYVIDNGQAKSTPLNVWIKERYGLDIDKELSFTFQYTDMETGEQITVTDSIITGTPYLSKNDKCILGTFWNPEGTGYVNYVIKLPSVMWDSSVESQKNLGVNVYVHGDILIIKGDAKRVEIMDLTGKMIYKVSVINESIPVNFLSPGMYIIKVVTSNKEEIVNKVMVGD